jgi:hypothetical protein
MDIIASDGLTKFLTVINDYDKQIKIVLNILRDIADAITSIKPEIIYHELMFRIAEGVTIFSEVYYLAYYTSFVLEEDIREIPMMIDFLCKQDVQYLEKLRLLVDEIFIFNSEVEAIRDSNNRQRAYTFMESIGGG